MRRTWTVEETAALENEYTGEGMDKRKARLIKKKRDQVWYWYAPGGGGGRVGVWACVRLGGGAGRRVRVCIGRGWERERRRLVTQPTHAICRPP